MTVLMSLDLLHVAITIVALEFIYTCYLLHTAQKMNFSISLVNLTKSTVLSVFGHIY